MTCVQEDGWKLSRNNYYQEGWLATANVRGVVGVTFTTSFCGGQQAADIPARTNYNLRGHRSEVGNLRGHRSEVGKLRGHRSEVGNPRGHRSEVGNLRGHRSEVGNPRGHRSEVGNLRGHRSEVGNRTLKIHAACTHLYVDIGQLLLQDGGTKTAQAIPVILPGPTP